MIDARIALSEIEALCKAFRSRHQVGARSWPNTRRSKPF
jgi:hypothetical protein